MHTSGGLLVIHPAFGVTGLNGVTAVQFSTLGPLPEHRLVDAKVKSGFPKDHPRPPGQRYGLGLELHGIGHLTHWLRRMTAGGTGHGGHPRGGFPLIRRSTKPGDAQASTALCSWPQTTMSISATRTTSASFSSDMARCSFLAFLSSFQASIVGLSSPISHA